MHLSRNMNTKGVESDGLDNLDFDNAIDQHASHTSISLIKQSISGTYEFSFSPISAQSMSKYISLLKSNKAVGHDGLHAVFLKCSGDDMSTSLCNVFNASISSCDFPSTLKWADINPIYKKKDNLCKENYRSVNVLAVVSKIFERILLTCAPRRSIVLQFFWHVDTRPISPFLFFFSSTFYLCIISHFLPDVFDTLTEVAGNRTSHFLC